MRLPLRCASRRHQVPSASARPPTDKPSRAQSLDVSPKNREGALPAAPPLPTFKLFVIRIPHRQHSRAQRAACLAEATLRRHLAFYGDVAASSFNVRRPASPPPRAILFDPAYPASDTRCTRPSSARSPRASRQFRKLQIPWKQILSTSTRQPILLNPYFFAECSQ
jgi:hypothetical protein